jgi:hypothetical protein
MVAAPGHLPTGLVASGQQKKPTPRFLAWVFEWTPEGLRQDAEVDHEAADVRAASRLLDRLGYWRFVSLLCGINRCENPKINRLSATLGVSRFRWIP